MSAYDELYLDDAMDCLGEAFDYAVNACDLDPDFFLSLFIASGYAARFEVGEPSLVTGMSGTELTVNVLAETLGSADLPANRSDYSLSPEYWAGWILAYCAWKTERPFKDIRRYMSMRELIRLYHPLHEADEERFVEEFEERVRRADRPTRLQELRKSSGMSQRELSERSDVNLRTLQQYESRAKDINKAAGRTLLALSRALNCRMEDLLEFGFVTEERAS